MTQQVLPPYSPPIIETINIIIDGGGSVITTGDKADIQWDKDVVIEGYTLFSVPEGSIVIDLWVDTYGHFPPTVADSITGSNKPTLTVAHEAQDLTLTGWSTAIGAGNNMRVNVDSCTDIKRATLALKVRSV